MHPLFDIEHAVLQFQALQSAIDASFWVKLHDLKLNEMHLSEDAVPLQGWYSASGSIGLASPLRVDAASFAAQRSIPQGGFAQHGTVHNVNSLDAFRSFDRAAAVQQASQRLWGDICSRKALQKPSLLNRFLLLSYADLKRYKFYYWFAFLALKPSEPIRSRLAVTLASAMGDEVASAVAAACDTHATASSAVDDDAGRRQPFWLVVLQQGCEPRCAPLSQWPQLLASNTGNSGDGAATAATCGNDAAATGTEASVHTDEAAAAAASDDGAAEVLLAFADPASAPSNPGWPLRNALLAAAKTLGLKRLRVVCARSRSGRFSPTDSLLLDVSLPTVATGWCASPGEAPTALGWEMGAHGKPAPRKVDLSASMDPTKLAEAAVDLNLKLMRWRAAPSLDLPRLAATRCLLLGAGTLGCAVARTLLGWGVRHITLLDNARVSYSNPVRQSLFNFEDCLGEGRPKAEAAAEALRRIFPSVHTRGVQLSVPMPGHPIAASEEESVRQSAEQLEELVRSHDVVFLLMDTREARWLPTLLAASAGKLALNAALGFDSYLVMRHGSPPLAPRPEPDLAAPAALSSSSSNAPAAALSTTSQVDVHGTAAQAHPVTVSPTSAAASSSELAAATAAAPAAHSHAPAEAASSGLCQPAEVEAAAEAAGVQQAPLAAGQMADPVPSPGGHRLGCYFCNDIVAPVDSTAGRALDQHWASQWPVCASELSSRVSSRCTVARPGLAPVAGALAVELMASVLQAEAAGEEALGAAPHMIRGQLSGFGQMALTGAAFSQCTACSPAVVAALRHGGWPFLLAALREPKMLEDLTGLTEMHAAAAALDDDAFAFGSDEEGGAASDNDEWTTL